MRRLLVVAAAIVVAMAAPTGARAQTGTLVESFSLDATDRETSSYSVVAGGRYALLLKGTLTDSAGAQFDALYCRSDACGGAGTYVDNVLGMGFTDLDRQQYPGTFGPIQMYVNPLPPYTSNSTSYATTQFTAPRSGRLELITNHGNFLARPMRSGTLIVDLYRYSEPAGGGGTSTGSTSTTDPCGALARALGLAPASATRRAAAGDGAACPPGDPKRGNVFNAPGPGRARTVYAKITTRTKKAIVTVANGASGHVILAVAGRRERARRLFETYAGWCMLGLYLDPDRPASYNSAAFAAVFNFKTGKSDVTGRQALCQYAAIVATVRAIEAEDAARANPPNVPADPPSPGACKVGRVVVTPRTGGVTKNVSPREMPALAIKQTCKQDPDGVMTMTYTATGGRTLSKELGTTRLGITIARGRDGAPGGTLAMRVRLFR
jgi:hypothetical protein